MSGTNLSLFLCQTELSRQKIVRDRIGSLLFGLLAVYV